VAVESRVGVAAHHHVLADPGEHRGRERPPGEVAAEDEQLGAAPACGGERRVQGRQVPVDVVERGDAPGGRSRDQASPSQESPRCTRWMPLSAASATGFPLSSRCVTIRRRC
jgi:hypothetical protein